MSNGEILSLLKKIIHFSITCIFCTVMTYGVSLNSLNVYVRVMVFELMPSIPYCTFAMVKESRDRVTPRKGMKKGIPLHTPYPSCIAIALVS